MKKTWKLALASAALVSGVAFTACSSDDEEILGGNETTVDPGASGEVKTQITFSIPHAKTQRSTADYVQQDGTTFNGMEKIYLLPFTNLSGDYVQASSTLAGNQQNLGNIANSGLTDGVETYSNVTLPYGDVAFLLYGESPSSAKKNQLTASYIAAPLAISSTPADITFSLTNIDEPAGLADFSTALRNLRADVQEVKAQAEAATATNDAVYQVVNNLVAGGASSVAEAQMSYLLNALSTAANSPSSATLSSPYETAINNLIAEITAAQAAVTTFYGSSYGDMPKAVYTFDWSASGASDAATMDEDIIATGSQLSYPTSLYYMTNAFPIDYTSGSVAGTNWGNDGLWTSGARATISAATTKIALNKTVNYAVGRLDVKVKANAAVLKANAAEGTGDTDVNVANEGAPAFTLTGVVVGGQPAQVGWDFTNTATDWKNMVYDAEVVAAAANIAYAADFSGVAVSSYVLGLPTQVVTSASQAVVNIALEITNNGPAFYGTEVSGTPAIIPTGATFYLVGQLDPYNATGAPNQVFASDYYTTANLNISSLKNAYATLPDLTSSQLEFSLKVDLTWQQGIVIDEDIE